MADTPVISFTDTLVTRRKGSGDPGYTEKLEHISGTIVVPVEGRGEIEVHHQGRHQALYQLDATGVHHSRMGFPNIRAEVNTTDKAEVVFFPFSSAVCDTVSRARIPAGTKADFHYHSGRTVRLILSGRVQMRWIQNNAMHEVELGENDWIVLPARTPYQTIVLDNVDFMTNYIDHTPEAFEARLNTIGRFTRKG